MVSTYLFRYSHIRCTYLIKNLDIVAMSISLKSQCFSKVQCNMSLDMDRTVSKE